MSALASPLQRRLQINARSRPRRLATATAETHKPERDWNQFISYDPDTTAARQTGEHKRSFRLAVKDNIATRGPGSTTTCASQMLADYESPFEATIVTQLRQRGAVVVGKTNQDEFGMGSHSLHSHSGPVGESDSSGDLAPTALSTGGSSGGSAVAVRLGDADVALGTDTGGSVRLPAAYGGIVGFKPSYGMLSRFGVVPYANSLDTVGLLARSVGPLRELVLDSGLWCEADTGRDPTSLSQRTRQRLARGRSGYGSPSSSAPLQGLAVGIPVEYNIAELDPRIRAAWTAVAELLRAQGATVAPVSLPSTRHALSAYYVLAPAEASSNLARYDGVRYGGGGSTGATASTTAADESSSSAVLYERVRGAGLGPEVQRRILLGAYALSSAARDNYFLQAQRVRRRVVRDFDAVFRLPNPLRDHDDDAAANTAATAALPAVDLCDLPEGLPLADRRGPLQVDFLLCPTAPTPAPLIVDVLAAASPVNAYMNDVFTVPASLAGLPAISIPAPLPASGTASASAFCPGLQLIGHFWDDARLLSVAEALMALLFDRPEDRDALLRHQQTGTAAAA